MMHEFDEENSSELIATESPLLLSKVPLSIAGSFLNATQPQPSLSLYRSVASPVKPVVNFIEPAA